jgi:hypothetical protein
MNIELLQKLISDTFFTWKTHILQQFESQKKVWQSYVKQQTS